MIIILEQYFDCFCFGKIYRRHNFNLRDMPNVNCVELFHGNGAKSIHDTAAISSSWKI